MRLRRKSIVRLAWNLWHVRELAESQKALLPWIENSVNTGDRGAARRAAFVLSSLSTFHLGLHPHHRKWFYKCQETLGTADFSSTASTLAARIGFELRAVLPSEGITIDSVDKVSISVTGGSVVGAINLGQIIGDIENNLNHPIRGFELDQLRSAIAELAGAIHDSKDHKPAEKAVMLRWLDSLSRLEEDDDIFMSNTELIDNLAAALGAMPHTAEIWHRWEDVIRANLSYRRPSRLCLEFSQPKSKKEFKVANVRIKVSDSARVGVLNLGTIIGDIEANLGAIDTTRQEAIDVREALRELAEAASNDPGLDSSQRKEYLEGVDFLAELASRPEKPTSGGVIKAIIGMLGQLSQASESLHTIWIQWGHSLAKFFGFG